MIIVAAAVGETEVVAKVSRLEEVSCGEGSTIVMGFVGSFTSVMRPAASMAAVLMLPFEVHELVVSVVVIEVVVEVVVVRVVDADVPWVVFKPLIADGEGRRSSIMTMSPI